MVVIFGLDEEYNQTEEGMAVREGGRMRELPQARHGKNSLGN